MVSFSCEVCNDTVIKKKLDQHRQRCYDAYFTCIDCSTTFSGTDYKSHTQCISEAEKYEKALYKGKPSKANAKGAASAAKATKPEIKKETKKAEETVSPTKNESKKSKKEKKTEKTEKSAGIDLTKYAGGSLGKVLKSMAKDTKTDKKDLLKKLNLELVDGKLVLTL